MPLFTVMTVMFNAVVGAGENKLAYWDLPVPQGTHPPKTNIRLEIRPGHPRLVFRANEGRTFDSVRRLYKEDPTFQAIFAKALAADPKNMHPAANAACWIVTGDDKYAEAAIHTMRTKPLGRSGEPYYSEVWSYALAYDWLYQHPGLRAEIKKEVEAKILERIGTELDDLDDTGMALWHGRNQAANGVMIAALAVGDLPGQENMLARATAHYIETLKGLRYSEGWPEGASYWIYNRAGPFAYAADCFLTATGLEEIEGIRIRDLMRNLGYWTIYQYGPNGVFEPYGDSAGSLRLGETGWWELTLDYYARLSCDPGLGAASDYLRNRSPDPYGKRLYYWNIVATYDPAVRPRQDYDPQKPELWMRKHLPQAMLFGRDCLGVAFFRGEWGDPNELYASFKAGHLLAHHDHYDTGTFTLQYGGELVPQSGFYGDYTGPHRLGYQIQTVSANSILVLCPNETSAFLRAKWPDRAWVSGGQRVIRPTSFYCVNLEHFLQQLDNGPHLRRAEITAWRSEPGQFDYIAADITSAYNSTRWSEPGAVPKVSLITRQFLYLRPERAFVIFDRVETTDEKFLPKFLLHSKNKPQTTVEEVLVGLADNGILSTRDRTIVTEEGDGRLTHLILLPLQTRTLKIGGEDYCFYAEIDGDQSNGFDGLNLVKGSSRRKGDPDRRTTHWRVEVEPTRRARSTRFLNVLLPRLIAENTALPEVRLLEANERLVALTVAKTTVIFSASGKALRQVELHAAGSGPWLLLDAAPRATYRLGSQRVVSDKDGVLFAESRTPGILRLSAL